MKLFSLYLFSVVFLFASCSGDDDNGSAPDNQVTKGQISPETVNNSATADNSNTAATAVPVMTFDKDVHDFGEFMQGEEKECEFKFTNTGDADLIISSAKGSCGCTVPEYPKTPIAPGESEVIKVVFNSKGKSNKFEKVVTIIANTEPNTNQVRVKGNIIVPEGGEKKVNAKDAIKKEK